MGTGNKKYTNDGLTSLTILEKLWSHKFLLVLPNLHDVYDGKFGIICYLSCLLYYTNIFDIGLASGCYKLSSTSDLQPSTAIANQLPGKLVSSYIL